MEKVVKNNCVLLLSFGGDLMKFLFGKDQWRKKGLWINFHLQKDIIKKPIQLFYRPSLYPVQYLSTTCHKKRLIKIIFHGFNPYQHSYFLFINFTICYKVFLKTRNGSETNSSSRKAIQASELFFCYNRRIHAVRNFSSFP